MALFLVTEEAFIHATFLEFVKLWVNGSQAFLQVQCHNGQAWIQLMSALGPPSAPHLFRQDHHHHGYHGPLPRQNKRRKGGTHINADCGHKALKVLQINTKFTFKRGMEIWQFYNRK